MGPGGSGWPGQAELGRPWEGGAEQGAGPDLVTSVARPRKGLRRGVARARSTRAGGQGAGGGSKVRFPISMAAADSRLSIVAFCLQDKNATFREGGTHSRSPHFPGGTDSVTAPHPAL